MYLHTVSWSVLERRWIQIFSRSCIFCVWMFLICLCRFFFFEAIVIQSSIPASMDTDSTCKATLFTPYIDCCFKRGQLGIRVKLGKKKKASFWAEVVFWDISHIPLTMQSSTPPVSDPYIHTFSQNLATPLITPEGKKQTPATETRPTTRL